MPNLQEALRNVLHNRGLADETAAANQRKAFDKVAERIEDLEARVEVLEKELRPEGSGTAEH